MWSRIARPLTGAVVLGLLWYFGWLDLRVLASTFGRLDLLTAATILIAVTVPLAAFRWWLLLKSLDFPMSFRWALRTTFISQFFNTFLPGAYGGDLVRAAMAYRATGGRLSRLTFTIAVDRLSGLLGLLVLGFGMIPSLPLQFRDALVPSLLLAFGAIAGGTAVGIIIGDRVAMLFERLPGTLGRRLAHVIREMLSALRAYLDRWPVLLAVLVLSIVQFGLILAALAIIGGAMKFNALSLSGYMIAGVWSLVANALPVTPGGIGVGEAAFSQLATLLESLPSGASYGTVFLCQRVLVAVISLIGVVPYWLRGETRAELSSLTIKPELDSADGASVRSP